MKKTARRCAARQDRSRAPRPRPAGTLFGVTAHRSACCPRLAPPVAPAKSGTKTSELRAAPGSASRRRHRTHQTTAPVGIMSASRFQPHSKQRDRPPLHSTGRAEKAREYGKKTRAREVAPASRTYRRPGRSGETRLAMHAKETAKVGPGLCFGNFLRDFLSAGA